MEGDVKPGVGIHAGLNGEDEESDRLKSSSWRSLFYFTLRSHVFLLSLSLVLSVASGVVIPAIAIILGKIFDIFTKYGSKIIRGSDLVQQVSTYGIALVVLGCASGILNAGFFMCWVAFGELQAKSAREKLFDDMLEKDTEWYDLRKAGINTLISRLQTHVRALQMATSQPLGFVIQSTVTALVALIVAFYIAWSLALVTLAVVPFAAVILFWISARMQPSIDRQDGELTQASKLANNAISAIDTVKCFNGQDFETAQYAKVVRNAARFYLIQAQSVASQIGTVRFVMLGMFVQGFWYGSHLVTAGTKSAGQVLTAFWACLLAIQAIDQVLPQMIVLEKGRAAGDALKLILTRGEGGGKTKRLIHRLIPGYCDGDIEFQNITFAYPARQNQPVLKNASFFFHAGETTYVVGRSGSGKSTLGYLLLNFYAPTSGDLLLDGNHIQLLNVNWLRNNITLVQQQSVLFNETIFKNIACGREDHFRLRKDEIRQAIETAQLKVTIDNLPQGLDTIVGVNGTGMSGGQAQRVDIARARLRDTPILILDEATSMLDQFSKRLVLEQIRKWRRGKTTIIITHDISEIQENKYVYVLDNGAIAQEGFRNVLEKTNSGPFGMSSQPGANPSTMSHHPTYDKSSYVADEIAPVAPPHKMESALIPRRSIASSALGSGSDWPPQRRSSLISAPLISAVAFPKDRMIPSSPRLDSPQGKNLPLANQLEELRSGQLSPIGKIFGADLQDRGQSTISTESLGSRQPLGQSTTPTRRWTETPRKKRKRTKGEQARIAPIHSILLTLWPTLTWRKRVILVSGFFFAGVHAAATPAFSYVFSKLLSTFYIGANRSKMALTWSLCVLAVAVIDSVASYMMHYQLEVCGQTWIDSLRIEALRRILDQPRTWFESDINGRIKLIESLDRNAEEMRNLIGRFAGHVFVAIAMMIMAVCWSLILCWKLTLVAVASAPLLYALTRSFEAVSGKWENKSNEAGEAAGSVFAETFTNIRIVRALTLESHFHEKYARATYRALTVGLKKSALTGCLFGVSDSGIIFATALIFYYGAVLASSGQYSIEHILTVFTMLLFSISTANAAISLIPQINSSRDTATRLLRLSNLPYKKSHEHTGHMRLSGFLGPITFSDVSFTYPSRPSAQILSSLSLTIYPGMTTALVGVSGSGKSTITSLIMGLYPPSSGRLMFDSVPISDLHLSTLRTLITIVPQTPVMFPTTIASNISYGLPTYSPLASLQSIRKAAAAAGIDGFISSLPQGYDTVIGSGGTGLSGGQAQRIAIARAIVRKPKLLILDEATSGLDAESAAVVRSMVRKISSLDEGECGVLVVTHEREMMRMCEDVVVLASGRVMERGGFDELLERKEGELRRMLDG